MRGGWGRTVSAGRARAGAHTEKQQSIERVYRVPLLSEKDGFLTIREQTSFDLDKVRVLTPRSSPFSAANFVDALRRKCGIAALG